MRRLTAAILLVAMVWALAPGCSGSPKQETKSKAAVIGPEALSKPFVASMLHGYFHRSSCRRVQTLSKSTLQGYDTREDAIADGFRACDLCRP